MFSMILWAFSHFQVISLHVTTYLPHCWNPCLIQCFVCLSPFWSPPNDSIIKSQWQKPKKKLHLLVRIRIFIVPHCRTAKTFQEKNVRFSDSLWVYTGEREILPSLALEPLISVTPGCLVYSPDLIGSIYPRFHCSFSLILCCVLPSSNLKWEHQIPFMDSAGCLNHAQWPNKHRHMHVSTHKCTHN